QHFSQQLAAHPEYIEILGVPLHESPTLEELRSSLQAEIDATYEDSAVLRAFRRFRHRHILRIGANDIIRDRPLEEITGDISRVAEAAVEVALQTAWRHMTQRFGEPQGVDGPARCVVLAFGKLGGNELNYSSDIDLMVVRDVEGNTRGRRSVSNEEFFGRVTAELVRLLSFMTDDGQAYRVDLRLRPEGQRGPLTRTLASTLSYYDTLGRTWERQALIKVRPIAGNRELGSEFLQAIEPFVYRKYLSAAEINEIKALKRRIEQKTSKAGGTLIDVKTGHGGIRDVEFTIQFLQLLNGGDLREVRQRNTLQAIHALARVGCLNDQEARILEDTYRFLRKVEHRLQLMYDLQTHRLPQSAEELHKLGLRLGYIPVRGDAKSAGDGGMALIRFVDDYQDKTELNRRILNHLLHDTFQGEDGQSAPEADLILDPEPDPELVRQTLSRYRFRDIDGAHHNLLQLAQESVPFLPTRRCRHFLANIAPRLLRALAEAPDPDMALVNLEKVTASLGAKGALWELFSFNAPSLKLYVDLCAWSQFLSEILINNPGMVDELLDSLVLNQPRTREELHMELADLCRGADDPQVILVSFRDKELLRIGVYDILGKEPLQVTLAALSDLAETILTQIAELELPPLVQRFGVPFLAEGPRADQMSRYVLLGLGKLGGRELSYSSDLDLILIYEGDGRTVAPEGAKRQVEGTTHFHFFSELATRIIRTMSQLGPYGRLYQVDMRLRPTGRSGGLVIPLAEFRRYYSEGSGQLWERQALTRARVVYGDPDFGAEVLAAVHEAAFGPAWKPEFADEIASMRKRLEASRGERSIKRGFGGLVDVEFLVQLYQLKYARARPALRSTNVSTALDALHAERLLPTDAYQELRANYDFLRRIESRMRIVHNLSQDELPSRPEDIDKLARRLGYEADGPSSAAERFLREMERRTARTRELFGELIERERAAV
ncbi:MAG: bifunctional [glutamate--ammonia ligase]-adenylyl-L-tyrosine phosphorylase/[glutamate--ammonia-ligase] adenylyltransferase, partial [Gemmataceae bacterium]|nr:bifunctional [glutamate--ammonia ligase]-adenylyl-L-tyrosine phosphorylase/[glutamate--ammonia-ligase] adenylyltransferase [Gemmataceae bacterium]